MRPRWQSEFGRFAFLTALYTAAGKLGLSMAILNPSASPVWPPSGIAIAALLILGRATWPAIAAGAFIVNFTTTGNAWTSVGIAAGNTLEALVAAALVERFANGRGAFDRTSDLLKFALLAGFVATLLSPTIGVTSLCLWGLPWREFASTWSTWWLGDVGGALVLAPPLILWGRRPKLGWTRWKAAEAFGLLLCIAAVGEVVFLGDFSRLLTSVPLAFLCTPPLLWAAFRFGPRETGTAGALLAAIATWATLAGRGPYSSLSPNTALLLLQAFLVVTMLTAMSLAAVVRERSLASEMLREKARELERSNADLEQFAYTASHDLREPLRNVLLHVELVERDYAGVLGTEADGYLRVASRSARRMLGLIHDLLAYARIGTTQENVQGVEVSQVVHEVLDDMRPAIDEAHALVDVGPLPRIDADPLQLGEVFQNLVGNAIKFRREESPRVQIGAVEIAGTWRFFVRDNGIGIDKSQRERVFDVFQRLHPRDRYPGSGIGLATCKRILQRRGGRIWVESDLGRGACFWFTLPSGGRADADGHEA